MAATVRSSTGGTFASTLGTTGIATSFPTGATAGDVLYLWVGFSAGAGTVGTVTATGWTALTTNPLDSTSSAGVLLRRVMQGGDSAPTFTWSANNSSGAWAMVAMQDASSTPEDGTAENTGSTATTTHTATGVDPASTDAHLLCFAAGDNPGAGLTGSYTAPSGMSLLENRGSMNAGFVGVASLALSSGDATGNKDFTSSQSTRYTSATVAVAAGATNATATPSAIALAAVISAPTVVTETRVTPAAIAASATIPSFSPETSSTVTVATVNAGTSLPAPGLSTGSTVTPAVVSVVTTLPAPTVETSGSATAAPATISGTATIPAVTVSTGGSVSPATIATATTIPMPAMQTGSSTSPAVIAAAVTLPAATSSTGASVAPASVTAVAVLPLPTRIGSPRIRGIVRGRWRRPSGPRQRYR